MPSAAWMDSQVQAAGCKCATGLSPKSLDYAWMCLPFLFRGPSLTRTKQCNAACATKQTLFSTGHFIYLSTRTSSSAVTRILVAFVDQHSDPTHHALPVVSKLLGDGL